MVWLYRLQQRLSITRNESIAILTLTVLFLLGLTVQHVREQQGPPLDADSLVARSPSAPSPSNAASAPSAPSPSDPVSLNDASTQRLQALNGIGPALAERIIEYRTTQRPFQRPAELKRVRGIGPKTLADLRPHITVKDETP
jgi:competence protein ComEA